MRGKNNVYAALARHLEDADNLDVIYITHAGAPEETKKLAETIYERHTVLSELLIRLGVDERTATDDACRIEHVISDESFQAIKQYYYQHKK